MYESTLIPANMVGGLTEGGSAGSPKNHSHRIEYGTSVASIDGARLVYSASQSGIVYIQATVNPGSHKLKGMFYAQSVFGFENDTGSLSGTAGRLNVSLAATKSVLSDFLDIYKGVLCVAGGPLAAAITGMDLVVAAGKIKQNYSLYVDALEAFSDEDVRKKIPTFHEHVFCNLYLARIESDLTGKVKEMAVKGVIKNKAVAETVGVFLGKVGEDAMKRLLKGIGKLIREVFIKVIDHKLSGKPLTEEQISLLAEHHVTKIYNELSWISLNSAIAKAMVREVADHAGAVRPVLLKIAKATDELAG